MPDRDDELRDALHAAIGEYGRTLIVPGSPQNANITDAVLATLREHRDAVLAMLGMVKVGQIERGTWGPVVRLGDPPVPNFDDGIDLYAATTPEADGLGPCHVTSCDNAAIGGEIGESGDLLLCADHLAAASTEETPDER